MKSKLKPGHDIILKDVVAAQCTVKTYHSLVGSWYVVGMLNYKIAWQKIVLMVAYLKSKTVRKKKRNYECTALTN